MGNVLTIKDPDLNTTSYTYDGLNRLLTDTNQLNQTRTYGYDENSNQTSVTDRNSQTRTFTFDRLNRQTQENWLNSSGNSIRALTSTYNVGSQLLALQDPDSSYQYTYDLNGRVQTITNAGTPGVVPVVLTYAYDGNGNLTSVVDTINGQAGGTTSYTFDPLDQVSQINQTGVGVQSKQVNLGYNALGQMATINRYAGSTNGAPLVAGTTYTYDSLNRLQQLSHKKADGSNIESYTYGYDAASRITSLSSQFANAAYNDNSTYSYDNTNQLAGADHSAISDEGYTYDANGNRTNTGYQTGGNNQLSSDGTDNYTYDNEGNLKTRTELATGKVRAFTWDYRNRLTGVTDKTSGTVTQQVSYTYDGLNQRLAKTVGSQTTRFVYDRGNVYLEFSGASATPSTRYLYGPMVDQVLAQESNGQTTWMLTDHLGSVRDLVNNSGAVVNHLTYDSFGQVVGSTGTVDTRYKFTGREYDSETGLYYYRARYFDAGVGRFIGQDPLGFGGDGPNLYAYVTNRPTDYVDPSGLYGRVGWQTRSIEYSDNGRKFANNIQEIDQARRKNPNVYVVSDITTAWILYSGNRVGTATKGGNQTKIPDFRQGGDAQGHIVGRQLGGSGTDFKNLFPQDRTENISNPWRGFEDAAREAIDSTANNPPQCRGVLKYTIKLDYPSPIRNSAGAITSRPIRSLRPTGVRGIALLFVGTNLSGGAGPVVVRN